MGSITARKGADGKVNYRAAIRINRKGFPTFSESKTFHSKKLAENWVKKREVEIQENPDILLGKEKLIDLTLSDAIDKYLDEVGSEYGRTKRYSLLLIKKLPIARNIITKIKSVHLAEHVALRKGGVPHLELEPIATSTQQHELLHIRGVLSHAAVMWEMDIDLNGFDKATAQLRKTRQISSSQKRDRLPSTDELIALTKYFTERWKLNRYGSKYPMHLIMWFAIFSCRREAELTRLTDVSNTVHPTVFTNETGEPLVEIESANLGRMTEALNIADNYLFNELFYDSPLEKENICEKVSQVSVFTKIPKNSIRIPIAGGGTYSPDFAYIVEYESGKKTLNLLIETKDKASFTLSEEEQRKIKHAELLFKNVRDDVEVVFKTQFESEKVVEIIKNVIGEKPSKG